MQFRTTPSRSDATSVRYDGPLIVAVRSVVILIIQRNLHGKQFFVFKQHEGYKMQSKPTVQDRNPLHNSAHRTPRCNFGLLLCQWWASRHGHCFRMSDRAAGRKKKFGNTVLLIRSSEMIEYWRWLNFSKPDILVGAFTKQEQSSFAKPYNPVRSASAIPQSLMDEARILVLRNLLRPLNTDLTHAVSCGALSKGVCAFRMFLDTPIHRPEKVRILAWAGVNWQTCTYIQTLMWRCDPRPDELR